MTQPKKKRDLLNILRYVLLLILAVYITLLFLAKGGRSATFEQVSDAVKKAADFSKMELVDSRRFRQFYGLNENEFEGVMCYYTNQTMEVEEVLLIKAKTAGDAQKAKEAAEARVQTQIKNFEGYGAAQVKLLKNAVVKVRGDYMFMAVSPDAEKLEKAFKKSLSYIR